MARPNQVTVAELLRNRRVVFEREALVKLQERLLS
jgi:hypothetical protein